MSRSARDTQPCRLDIQRSVTAAIISRQLEVIGSTFPPVVQLPGKFTDSTVVLCGQLLVLSNEAFDLVGMKLVDLFKNNLAAVQPVVPVECSVSVSVVLTDQINEGRPLICTRCIRGRILCGGRRRRTVLLGFAALRLLRTRLLLQWFFLLAARL